MPDFKALLAKAQAYAAQHRMSVGAAAVALGLGMGTLVAALAPARADASPASAGRMIRIVVETPIDTYRAPERFDRLTTLTASADGLPEDPALVSARSDAEVRGYLVREDAQRRALDRDLSRTLAAADATLREAPVWPAAATPAAEPVAAQAAEATPG